MKMQNLMRSFFGLFFSATPLVTLMAFIFVPAHKRIVFIQGCDLLVTLFVQTVVRVFATWAVKTEFAQTVFRNMTDYANTAQAERDAKYTPNLPKRLGDEL